MKIKISIHTEIEMGEREDASRLEELELVLARYREVEELRWKLVAEQLPGLKVSFDDDQGEEWKGTS